MLRRMLFLLACVGAVYFAGESAQAQFPGQSQAQVQAPIPTHAQGRAYGRHWGQTYNTQDWERFYHYPYVYYPQNYWGSEYYRSAESLYYRYPQEMRIPVYNKKWQNYYPQGREYRTGPSPTVGLYHWGHHHILDVF